MCTNPLLNTNRNPESGQESKGRLFTLTLDTADTSRMIFSKAAVSSACFWLCNAIFSLNFRGLAMVIRPSQMLRRSFGSVALRVDDENPFGTSTHTIRTARREVGGYGHYSSLTAVHERPARIDWTAKLRQRNRYEDRWLEFE